MRQAALVSIVLPTYNGERYLPEAIASCVSQTYPHFELIVVDDGSSADVRQLVLAPGDARIHYLRHDTNAGLPTALNTGFAQAHGTYLTWTSDDNRYHPDAIARMVEYLEARPEIGLVYAGYREIDEWGAPGALWDPSPPESIWAENCVRACFLYRREVQERVGTYDPAVPLVEDYDYWLRTARWFRLGHLEATLYDLRIHPRQLSHTLSFDRRRDSHLRLLAKLADPAAGPPVPAAFRRRARIAMHAAYGRAYFLANQIRSARRDLLAAVCLQPSNLLDWEIIRPLGECLVGGRTIHWIRRLVHYSPPYRR